MARLYDRIMAEGFGIENAAAALFAQGGYREALGQATVFACDNVSEYWEEVGANEFILNMEKHLPKTVSPVSPAFLESRAFGPASEAIRSFGALTITHDLRTEEGRQALKSPFFAPNNSRALSVLNGPAPTIHPDQLADARFLTEWWLFYEPNRQVFKKHEQARVWVLGWYALPAREDGSPILNGQHPLRRAAGFAPSRSDIDLGAAMTYGQGLLLRLYLAVSFMHCKNVATREVTQAGFDRQVWQKKHKRRLVRYHVLDIDPMRKVLRTEGRIEEVGLKRALHICRGHFATYTEDAPLFGRVTGTFWRPQHVRGSKSAGAVVKDYNVKAPRR